MTLVTENMSVKHIFLIQNRGEKADGRIWKGWLEINILMARSCSDWNKQSFTIDFNESRIKYVMRKGCKHKRPHFPIEAVFCFVNTNWTSRG